MTEASQLEVLAILGVVFGGAALLLAVFILIFLYRFRIRSASPLPSYTTTSDYNTTLAQELLGAKTTVWAHAETRPGNPTAWRPFWPIFCGIALFTLLLVSIPLLIWGTSANIHVVHHNGTHHW